MLEASAMPFAGDVISRAVINRRSDQRQPKGYVDRRPERERFDRDRRLVVI